jgi:hypothetical protein
LLLKKFKGLICCLKNLNIYLRESLGKTQNFRRAKKIC